MFAIRSAIRQLAKKPIAKKLKQFNRIAFSEKYLLFTNMTISLTLSATGDSIEQQFEIYCNELDKWDKRRTMNMGIAGISVGLICHYWYKFLDRNLPGRGIGTVFKKIILDQLICSPAYLSAFFFSLGMLEHRPGVEIWTEIKAKAWRLYAAEWVVWPFAQFVNFYWVSPRYRILYDNTISLGYDVYISQVRHRKPK